MIYLSQKSDPRTLVLRYITSRFVEWFRQLVSNLGVEATATKSWVE